MRGVLVAVLVGACVVSGCIQTTTKVWERPGASRREYAQDRYVCLKDSQQRSGMSVRDGWSGFSTSEMNTNPTLFNACMNARGWTQSAKAGSGEAADPIRDLLAQARDLCVREEFKPHFAKSPCAPNEATLDQLADRSKASAAEKTALSNWRTEATEISKKIVEAHRAQAGANSAALATALETAALESDRLALELFSGRIARGDYNKLRLDLFTRTNAETRKILGEAPAAKPNEAAPVEPLAGI